ALPRPGRPGTAGPAGADGAGRGRPGPAAAAGAVRPDDPVVRRPDPRDLRRLPEAGDHAERPGQGNAAGGRVRARVLGAAEGAQGGDGGAVAVRKAAEEGPGSAGKLGRRAGDVGGAGRGDPRGQDATSDVTCPALAGILDQVTDRAL